ncbi:MAG: carboxypeptidase-like regulatory domain-containing protein [Bacteroidetes bacterium]|nr:carboxypeptidase-like regulatory domain-containing protein [Bacteroidota bacterium]
MHRFSSALFLLLFTLMLNTNAQHASISGKIFAKDSNVPLSYVNVIVSQNIGTYSNESGEFRLENLQAGIYNISFICLGFHDITLQGKILSSSNSMINLGNIYLSAKAIQIREVTITKTNKSYNEDYAGTNTIVSKKDLEIIQAVGTEEILKLIPGINVAGDMGISNRLNVGIRGSYPRRSEKILVLEDGTPIAPAPYLSPAAYYNPPADRLDGIEVIKGSEILKYGSKSIFGAINYITKKPPLKPTLNVSLIGGTNNYLSQYITYGGTWKKVGAEIQVLNKTFGGYTDNSSSKIFNTTGKLYTELSKNQSLYFKFNYHQENSQATYSGLTPFTFESDPKQNPFDADDLITTRFAIDVVHKIAISEKMTLRSKVYGSKFKRYWWRQNTAMIKGEDVELYLGTNILESRYSYLANASFNDNDYIRVGKLVRGYESTKGRNRDFSVGGIEETLQYDWNMGKSTNQLELGFRYHSEQFRNQEITNDASRTAREGTLVKDEKFALSASSIYLKDNFNNGRISFYPIIRYESVSMTKLTPEYADNYFKEFSPGATIEYSVLEKKSNDINVYLGGYKGYSAPTSGYGFLKIEEGVSTEPEEEVDMRPEISNNIDAGLRSSFLKNIISLEVAVFNNHINNFYAAGRKEAFESLGSVRIRGTEIGFNIDPLRLGGVKDHALKLSGFITLMNSKILSGELVDKDLFKTKHTNATKAELINMINAQRQGYDVYFEKDSLFGGIVTSENFDEIEKIKMQFGDQAIANNYVPYVPNSIVNLRMIYSYKSITVNASYHLVGEQFTEYLNFENETADGAIGKLDSHSSIDAGVAYAIHTKKHTIFNNASIFLAAKNITNQIYRASRLHRVSSGIMPGGLRQINVGLRIKI